MSSFHLWISLSKHLLSEVLTITFREGRTTAFSTTWMQQLLPYAGFIRPSPFAWLSRLFPQSWLGNKGSLLGDYWPTTSQQQGQHPHDIHLCNSELSISRWEWRSHHITTPRGSGGQGREQWVGRFQQLLCARAQIPPTTHCVCVPLRATWFCNPFSWALLTPHKHLGNKMLSGFLCSDPSVLQWGFGNGLCSSWHVLLIPQFCIHVLCRPHTTSPICKPSRSTSKLGTYLLIFWEFQPQMPKALRYGSTVKIACFH